MDEATDVKNKLGQLTKKDSNSFLQKDLGDIVYEKKIPKDNFVNMHGSTLMVSVLVVINKKNVDKFKASYMNMLLEFYEQDYEKWQQRTKQILNAQHQGEGVSEEDAKMKVEEEFEHEKVKHEKLMKQPGVVPNSDKFLMQEDPEGNQLWRIVVMKEQAVDYIKVMKKNGYQGQ